MKSDTTLISTYEYEERTFLDEDSFLRIKDLLDKTADKKEIDNKQSFFYVLPDVNLSIAHSKKETKVKYKGGQLGKGNGFEEIEYRISEDSLEDAVALFTRLLGVLPQNSFQYRINYMLNDSIEIALKYTEMWGFHLEAEKTYTAKTTEKKLLKSVAAKESLAKLAEHLNIRYITDEEMSDFTIQCKKNIRRGDYSSTAFKNKYGSLFGL